MIFKRKKNGLKDADDQKVLEPAGAEKNPSGRYKRKVNNRSVKFAFYVIIFFGVMALFAPFIASQYPLLVFSNESDYEIPLSPAVSAVFTDNDVKLQKINFRELSRTDKITAIFAIVSYSPYETELDRKLTGPTWGRFGHYLGTDELGRDVAARIVHGATNSMLVGLIAVGISLIFGIIIGAIAGYYGGWTDLLLSRFIEIVICFPSLILIMAVLSLLQPSLVNIMVVIGVTGWTGTARVIRGEVLKRRKEDFVMASKLMGASDFRVLFFHILPNSLAPVIVMAAFGIASAVLLESALSFLGIGVPAPEPSWGQILKVSQEFPDIAWWLTFYPGLFIFLTVVSFNLLGDRLRQILNPRENFRGGS